MTTRYEFRAYAWTTIDGTEEEARQIIEEFLALAEYNGCGVALDESPADTEQS